MAYSPPFGLQGKPLNTLQTCLVAAPAFMLYGYNQANVGELDSFENWSATFPEIDTLDATGAEKASKKTLQGFTVASFVIGSIIGALSCTWVGDWLGRRKSVFIAAVLTLIGVILEASSFQYAQIVVGRIILGTGAGMLTSLIPVWQSETSSSHNRGKQVVLDGLFLAFGYFLQGWINLGFFELKRGPATWRAPIAIGGSLSIVVITCTYLFPESPRWLTMKRRREEARTITAIIRGLPADSLEVEAEIASIQMLLEGTEASEVKLSHIFTNGPDRLFYRFCLCMLLQFYPQLSGSNLISVYSSTLFRDNLHMGEELSKILAGAVLTWKFLSCFVAFYVIDRLGRRFAFILSFSGMSACMIAMAVATSFPTENQSAQIAGAFFIFMFNFFVPIGCLGANFCYCAEVAPLRLRMAMASISTANHWLWNFVIVMITPVALETIKWKYFLVFASVAATAPVAVYFLFPETMGRNLEDIDLMFRESPSIWSTVRYSKKRPLAMASEHVDKAHEERIEKSMDIKSLGMDDASLKSARDT